MAKQNIKAILFDLGNVLIDFDHYIAAKRISAYSTKSAGEIFELFFDSPLTADFECGRISDRDFFLQVKAMLGLSIAYAEFVPIWNEIFFLSEKNRAVYALAKRLKKNYSLGLVSNINALHYVYLKSKFPVFDVFHQLMTSFEFGVQKPSPLIYAKAVQALGVNYQEVFYTDDRQDLIDSARSLGMQGFVFKDIVQLEHDLRSAGVQLN
jgi:putative hydrolase of the HAD superfamily